MKIINAWIIYRHIQTALDIYSPEAGLFTPAERASRLEKLRQDIKSAYRLELITTKQLRKLLRMIDA